MEGPGVVLNIQVALRQAARLSSKWSRDQLGVEAWGVTHNSTGEVVWRRGMTGRRLRKDEARSGEPRASRRGGHERVAWRAQGRTRLEE